MCGICGFCNIHDDWRENIHRMNNQMIDRGPDSEGIWSSVNCNVVLGHRRLSILDLSNNGSQPMMSHSKRYVLVLNGEIYNFKEIAEKLIRDRYVKSFKGTSDTEVLVEAIEAYGLESAILQCKGMFGLAVYDIKNNCLCLARDRMGEKPLYYGFIGEGFIFASDLRAIQHHSQFKPIINRKVLRIYFQKGYIPAPYSIYENVFKLEPGHIIKLHDLKRIEDICYWNIFEVAVKGQRKLFKGSESEASDELERLLKKSISQQMIADVPVGAFLSGGIDSSLVVSLMTAVSGGSKVNTYTVKNRDYLFDESVIANKVANCLGISNTIIESSVEDTKKIVPMLYRYYSEPFSDPSMIATFMVSKLAKKYVTVSLTGDAGDELFLGYSWQNVRAKQWQKLNAFPLTIRENSKKIINSSFANNFKSINKLVSFLDAKNPIELHLKSGSASYMLDKLVIGDKQDKKLELLNEIDYQCAIEYISNPIDLIALVDQSIWLSDDILCKVDRAAMAVSLETRVPLLDKDIIEFSWSLPSDYKYSAGVSKRVMKNILYKYVPKELYNRKKQGFGVPLYSWLKAGDLFEWADSLLEKNRILNEGILDCNIVQYYWREFLRNNNYSRYIWSILMFESWLDGQRGE